MEKTYESIRNEIEEKMRRLMSADEVFDQAFTHSSLGLPNNERLAFLGDAVLRLIIRERLFREHPDWKPGDLHDVSANELETNANFARHATDIGLIKHLKHDGSVHEDGIVVRATLFEAYFGAIYLTEGLAGAMRAVKRFGVV